MTKLRRKMSGNFVGRGPNGERVPPKTPAYSTSADIQVASISELLAAVAALGPSGGGSVIEITASSLAGQITIPNNSNSASWTENVLVRPRLGERCSVGLLSSSCANVTFAGLDFEKQYAPSTDQCQAYLNNTAHGSGFWRCRNLDPILIQFRALTDPCSNCFLCEWVQPDWQFFYVQDFCNFGSQGPLFDGCYLAPMAVTLYDDDWTVGATTYANPGRPFDYHNDGAVQAGTSVTLGICDGEYSFGPPNLALLMYLDDSRHDAVTATVSVNGTEWASLTLVGPDYRLALRRGDIDRSFSDGDVVTATFDKDVTGVHLAAGVDITGNPSAGTPGVHGDVFQAYASGEFSPGVPRIAKDFTWRDSVIGATTSLNSAFQFNPTLQGEFVWDNCFIGATGGNNVWGNIANPGYDIWREYVQGCDWQGQASLTADGLLSLFANNTYNGLSGTYTPDGTNTNRGAAMKTPPPPNLAAIWPECPPL